MTFSDSCVKAVLKDTIVLRADVAASILDAKALLARFRLFGPPGAVVLDCSGQELAIQKIGCEAPEQLPAPLARVGAFAAPRRAKHVGIGIHAHAFWAGAATLLARRRWRISRRPAALTVDMAVMPDIPHLSPIHLSTYPPIVGWSVFGDGSMAAV